MFGDYVPVDVQKESVIQYPHLNKSTIEHIVKVANFKFYGNPAFIFANWKKFLKPKIFIDSLKSLFKKLFWNCRNG